MYLYVTIPANHALYGMSYSIDVVPHATRDFKAINIIDGWANTLVNVDSCLATTKRVNPWYMVELSYTIEVQEIALQNSALTEGSDRKSWPRPSHIQKI